MVVSCVGQYSLPLFGQKSPVILYTSLFRQPAAQAKNRKRKKSTLLWLMFMIVCRLINSLNKIYYKSLWYDMSLICSASRHRHIRSESWSSDTTVNILMASYTVISMFINEVCRSFNGNDVSSNTHLLWLWFESSSRLLWQQTTVHTLSHNQSLITHIFQPYTGLIQVSRKKV